MRKSSRYENAMNISARWKARVRKYPLLTKVLQFIFDPSYATNKYRNELISSLGENSRILNIGSGVKKFSGRCINLDIEDFANVDVIADAQDMPFLDNSFDAVIFEYVIEHIPDSTKIIQEIYRVLKKGGAVYSTVPFIQSYHGNPVDYYRFTIDGFNQLWKKFGFFKVICKPLGGPTAAFICIIKEYFAVLLSCNNKTLYAILSQLLIIPLFPFKYIDVLLIKNSNAHNISYSIVYVGKKR